MLNKSTKPNMLILTFILSINSTGIANTITGVIKAVILLIIPSNVYVFMVLCSP